MFAQEVVPGSADASMAGINQQAKCCRTTARLKFLSMLRQTSASSLLPEELIVVEQASSADQGLLFVQEVVPESADAAMEAAGKVLQAHSKIEIP